MVDDVASTGTLCICPRLGRSDGGLRAELRVVPLVGRGGDRGGIRREVIRAPGGVAADVHAPVGRGLHSLTSELNLRTFGNTSLTLELNWSVFRTHPRVNLGHMGDKVLVSLS